MSVPAHRSSPIGLVGGRVWVQAFVFDMDGLLFDTEALARAALEHTFAAFGAVLTPERHRQLVGLCETQTSDRLRAWLGAALDCDRFHDLCKAQIEQASQDGVPLKPGARTLLRRLRASGAPIALATSNARCVAERNLARANLADSFDVVCAREDVVRGKPDPDLFLLAAERLQLAPSLCAAVEDSPIGAQAALAAGLPTLLVPDLVAPPAALRPRLLAVYEDLRALAQDLVIPAHAPLARTSAASRFTLHHGDDLGSLS